MNRYNNMRIVRELSHDAKHLLSNQSAEGNSRSISFAEFIERLEEHAGNLVPAKKSLKDLTREILRILSVGTFKNIIG